MDLCPASALIPVWTRKIDSIPTWDSQSEIILRRYGNSFKWNRLLMWELELVSEFFYLFTRDSIDEIKQASKGLLLEGFIHLVMRGQGIPPV